jgi:hypothetical protein
MISAYEQRHRSMGYRAFTQGRNYTRSTVISNGTAAPVVHSTVQSPHSPLLTSSGDSLIHRPPPHPESAASLLPRIRCHRLPCAPVCLCRPPRTLPFSPPEATTKPSLFGLATLHELRRRIISARRRALSPLGTGMGAQEADASGAGTVPRWGRRRVRTLSFSAAHVRAAVAGVGTACIIAAPGEAANVAFCHDHHFSGG